ncbi:Transposase [Streptomyces sp. PAN_FS17]|nr:Transposase [Streptomyces sp. PAN_FS17]
MIDTGDIDVFLGLDFGKGEHHATAVTPAGKKAFDKRLPNTEPKHRDLFAKLQAKHGTVLVVVDQPASIGALPLAEARDMDCPVAYLPGLTMRRIADLYPGEAKTNAKDAFIIADAARAMPHTLRAIDGEDEMIAELEMIAGFDDDLAGEATRVANRLHGLLTQIHPSLERVWGLGCSTRPSSRCWNESDPRPRSARPTDGAWSPCCGRAQAAVDASSAPRRRIPEVVVAGGVAREGVDAVVPRVRPGRLHSGEGCTDGARTGGSSPFDGTARR